MNDAIDKAVRGKEKTIKNVNIQKIIDNVVEEKERLSSIQETIDNIDELCDKAVTAVDKFKDEANDAKAETDDAKSKKSTATTLASRVAGWYKYVFGYMNAVASREHALTKECAGESMSICRAVLSYKPANESWSAARESSAASILDSYGY